MFFGHGCKQKSRCSYLHPRSNEEPSDQKEEVDIVSHVETKDAAVSTTGEAPIVVRDVDMLAQLQGSDISPRLKGSHSQVMEIIAQFYEENDVLMEEILPLPIPTPFLNHSARLPEPETAGSLEAFVKDMDRAVELGGSMRGILGNVSHEHVLAMEVKATTT